MARRVFFSFHFERDVWRVGQVRNTWLTKPDRQSAGYWDAAKWEEVKKQGDAAVKQWIDNAMKNTSVTVVLIGAETASRKWVTYEIQQSYNRGNAIIGIYIHNMKDRFSNTDTKGVNPLSNIYVTGSNPRTYLSELYPTYDWVNDRGYENLAVWIEAAAKKAGK